MSASVRVGDGDLCALAAIVSQDRPDLPAREGVPPSLLADLMSQIRCEAITLTRYDTSQRVYDKLQDSDDDPAPSADWVEAMWANFWDCEFKSYPARTGDLRSVIKLSDFYSARQLRSTRYYADIIRPQGTEHLLMLTLPDLAERTARERYVRLVFHRGPGPDFSERDRALLVLLRPHLQQAYLDTEQRRSPVPRLTPRQTDLLRLVADGRTNAQIARRLGLSEGTVRTHLENIYDRLGVSSRTAAVLRAFPDLAM